MLCSKCACSEIGHVVVKEGMCGQSHVVIKKGMCGQSHVVIKEGMCVIRVMWL